MAFSPDDTTIASGSHDNTIKLWNVATGENTATLHGHDKRINFVAYSPDGKTLASASADKTIKLWEVMPGKTVEK